MKSFSDKCYKILKTIPKGKVTTYKAIAQALNSKAYRAVGNAMNKNPHNTNDYPCHRVIQSNGKIGGYAHGTEAKIERLKSEGIIIEKGKIDLNEFEFRIN